MEPSRARMSAGCKACARKLAEGSANCKLGRPVGTGPMMGASLNHSTPSSVPTISAIRGAGRNRVNRRGQSTPTASVTAAMAKALLLILPTTSGTAPIAPIGPPGAVGAPRNGKV